MHVSVKKSVTEVTHAMGEIIRRVKSELEGDLEKLREGSADTRVVDKKMQSLESDLKMQMQMAVEKVSDCVSKGELKTQIGLMQMDAEEVTIAIKSLDGAIEELQVRGQLLGRRYLWRLLWLFTNVGASCSFAQTGLVGKVELLSESVADLSVDFYMLSLGAVGS